MVHNLYMAKIISKSWKEKKKYYCKLLYKALT